MFKSSLLYIEMLWIGFWPFLQEILQKVNYWCHSKSNLKMNLIYLLLKTFLLNVLVLSLDYRNVEINYIKTFHINLNMG